jgi:hypothetical protein
MGDTGCIALLYQPICLRDFIYPLFLLTKYSVLLFFWRIFSSSNLRIPIYILASVITAWGLGVVREACSPPRWFNLTVCLMILDPDNRLPMRDYP